MRAYFGLEPLGDVGKFLVTNKIAKIVTAIISLFLLIGLIVILSYAYFYSISEVEKKYLINSVMPFFLVPLVIIAISISIHYMEELSATFETELKNLRAERVEITQKIEDKKELDIFHTIQLSLNQLNEYYTINKNQARSSFQFSLFSIVVGLVTLLTGIWLNYLKLANIELTYITGICGVILEFIGGAYFFMYKKSLEQVNFFFGQLIKIQDTMLAINLVDNVDDKTKKIEMTERIVISLLERSLK